MNPFDDNNQTVQPAPAFKSTVPDILDSDPTEDEAQKIAAQIVERKQTEPQAAAKAARVDQAALAMRAIRIGKVAVPAALLIAIAVYVFNGYSGLKGRVVATLDGTKAEAPKAEALPALTNQLPTAAAPAAPAVATPAAAVPTVQPTPPLPAVPPAPKPQPAHLAKRERVELSRPEANTEADSAAIEGQREYHRQLNQYLDEQLRK